MNNIRVDMQNKQVVRDGMNINNLSIGLFGHNSIKHDQINKILQSISMAGIHIDHIGKGIQSGFSIDHLSKQLSSTGMVFDIVAIDDYFNGHNESLRGNIQSNKDLDGNGNSNYSKLHLNQFVQHITVLVYQSLDSKFGFRNQFSAKVANEQSSIIRTAFKISVHSNPRRQFTSQPVRFLQAMQNGPPQFSLVAPREPASIFGL